MQINRRLLTWTLAVLLFCSTYCFADQSTLPRDYNITPVSFNKVHVNDGFWSPRLDTNSRVTIPHSFEKSEETGRIRNFEKAAGLCEGGHEGYNFNDSDVYKIMEGAAYCDFRYRFAGGEADNESASTEEGTDV